MARWRPAMLVTDRLWEKRMSRRTHSTTEFPSTALSTPICPGAGRKASSGAASVRSRRSRTRGGLLDVSAITVGGQRRHGNGGIDWSPTQSMPSTRRPLSLAAASSRRASRFFSSLSDTEQPRSCLHELQPWSQMDCKTIQRVLLSCHHMPYHQVRCLRLRLVKTNSVRRSRGGLFRPSHAH